MFKDKDDSPSVAEFVKAFQESEKKTRENVAKGIIAGLVVGYALRRKS